MWWNPLYTKFAWKYALCEWMSVPAIALQIGGGFTMPSKQHIHALPMHYHGTALLALVGWKDPW